MARKTFFSFDYRNVWKVNQIRNLPNVISTAAAGFQDASLWENAKKESELEIKKMIDDALKGTTVTVVLVTCGTSDRRFINYEIDQSLARGNGLVAVKIHHLKDQHGNSGKEGIIPPKIQSNGFRDYTYTTPEELAEWIEEAAKIAGK